MPLVSACIGLGSNLGQPRSLLLAAWQFLAQHPAIVPQQLSSPYCTKPVGMNSLHWFINAAGLLRTSLAPEALLDVLLATEQRFGRVRFPEQAGYHDRTLDLDLLLIEGQILRTERLILPHPALHERLFVLAPLAEIAPQLCHPVLNKSIAELLAESVAKTEIGDVKKVQWEENEEEIS
ncbi:2-amino-4-hydroxy-6-hydroxymethyldihydropteridine diphosphokinase [Candidatus Electronema sp. PJ]|uniref:2-amino-4-hydroxy-6- hydroxymethyldihydropteridine diphosphokinase n=1 Tax=Candidatus Electronema sp. PJ TaxID=3401572 RepID=UPI003AA8D05D